MSSRKGELETLRKPVLFILINEEAESDELLKYILCVVETRHVLDEFVVQQ